MDIPPIFLRGEKATSSIDGIQVFRLVIIYYKYILQLLTKYFVQYDVIDLQAISSEDLQEKPFVLLYYIGWMEHSAMVKIVEYIKNGGVVLSFGDIPLKNAFFEEDLTLNKIYQARCEGEHPSDTPFRWTGTAPFDNLSAVKYLCSYTYF